MDKTLCNICIHSKDSELHKDSVCEICYRIDSIGNGENHYFIEKTEAPDYCGKCNYCNSITNNAFVSDKPFCSISKHFNKDDRSIQMHYIRRNYLRKGTPKWCPLRGK